MSLYGDLDISVIDELLRDEKPIPPYRFDSNRLKLVFLRDEIALGRQAIYIVSINSRIGENGFQRFDGRL